MQNMQLEEPFYETDAARIRHWLPWLHLFRAFRMAIGLRPLLIACVALLLLGAGESLIARLPFAPEWTPAPAAGRTRLPGGGDLAFPGITWDQARVQPIETLQRAFSHGPVVLTPLWSHLPASGHLFRPGQRWSDVITGWLLLLWTLFVWAVCGVMIARMQAVSFAREASTSLQEAGRFAATRLATTFGAPLLPLVGVGCLWLICLIGGGIGRIPGIGPVITGVFWWLALLAGLGMAIILLGLAVGWPLMLCAIAADDGDAFDGFSRVYSYLFGRPWYALWLVVLVMLYGSVLLVLIGTLSAALQTLAAWAVGSGMGEEALIALLRGPGEADPQFATLAVRFWQNVWELLMAGFVVSYFWTAATLTYFLLRKSADATPLDHVVLEMPASPESLPLVGMAATARRQQERNEMQADDSQQKAEAAGREQS